MKKIKSKLIMGFLSLTMILGVYTSCKKSSTVTPPSPIGGYNSSDEVAAANNIAKWSFDNSLTESKQSLAGTGTNTAFTTGVKGQAWQGSSVQPRSATYSAGTAIPSISSY